MFREAGAQKEAVSEEDAVPPVFLDSESLGSNHTRLQLVHFHF